MTDTLLLRHVPLYSAGKFRYKNCFDVFAFSEFSPEDSEDLKEQVGIECDRATYSEYMQDDRHFRAMVYSMKPVRVIHYVFSSKEDMHCKDDYKSFHYDVDKNYFANDYNATNNAVPLVDELTAIQRHFSMDTAYEICNKKGWLREVQQYERLSGVLPDVLEENIFLQYYKPALYAFKAFDCNGTYAFREFYLGRMDNNVVGQGVYCNKTKYFELLNGNTNFKAITYYQSVAFNSDRTYHTIRYVFSSLEDMQCTSPYTIDFDGFYNREYGFRSNHVVQYRHFLNHHGVSEDHAITQQFGALVAHKICKNYGMLPNIDEFTTVPAQHVVIPNVMCCPCTILSNVTSLNETANVMSSNVANVMLSVQVVNATTLINRTSTLFNATTVPVSEMEFLSSVATVLLASPVLLAPVILAIHNLSEIFFDGLANLFTNLGRKK